jgi:hypothetical protein
MEGSGTWTEFAWLTTETSGRLLWTRWGPIKFLEFLQWLSDWQLLRKESEPELLYDWLFTATSPSRLISSNFIFQLNTCGHSPYVTSSLTRGWFFIYNCCWCSPAQSFSGTSPAELMTTFYCLRFETLPTWRTRSPYLSIYPPGTGWPGYSPRYWVPFSSPPTTRMAMVKVFEPASTRDCLEEKNRLRGVRHMPAVFAHEPHTCWACFILPSVR